jgi:transposase
MLFRTTPRTEQRIDYVHLLFLPAYSPVLQPAEYLWALTNTALATCHFVTIG